MDSISHYFQLVKDRPELFAPSEYIPLCLHEPTVRAFAASTGTPVGVVYDNTPYYMVLADVCIKPDGQLYTYARVVYPRSDSNGVVVIPRMGDRFGLLSIFRHPPRTESGGEFPRGYAEDMHPAENAAKELREEIGAHVDPKDMVYLGDIQSDTGLSAGRVQVYLAPITQAAVPSDNGEGIHDLQWLTQAELMARVAQGTLTDGLTLSAFLLYLSHMTPDSSGARR